VLPQSACGEQTAVFAAHSSTSRQVTPSPVQPALQAQVKAPTVLVQVAFALQFELLVAHSSTSPHTLPVPIQPVLQAQL
jgi:hypothetical protein